MVLFDPTRFRYLTKDDFRVLTAIEMGMKNHEIVPTTLILRIACLKKTNGHMVIRTLAKYGLVHHDSLPYDGYKLTYMGYDFLAIKAFCQKGLIKGIGQRIGVGKESDVYEVLGQNDQVLILKIHRLGRICFRNVKQKRDYLGKRKSASWLYLSRLAAVREYAYLKALYHEGFPTPIPYEINRHCVLMSRIDGRPLHSFTRLKHPAKVYNTLMNLLVRFAQAGLIHGDFNEFNLLLNNKEEITVIDFPQMVSINHPNGKEFFDRDSHGIRRFFQRKLGYEFDAVPEFNIDIERQYNLDISLRASGASKMYIAAFGNNREQEDFDRIMHDAHTILQNTEGSDDEYEDEDDYQNQDETDDSDVMNLISPDYNDDEEDEDGEDDDRQYMRARHAKNADKYNPLDSYLDREKEDEINEENDIELPSLMQLQLDGVELLDDESSQGMALYSGDFELSDDDDDDDANEDDEDDYDEDDEQEGDDKKGYYVGSLFFATRGERKAYLARQKELESRIQAKQRRQNLAPTREQVRLRMKRNDEKTKIKTKSKIKKAARGGDQRTRRQQREMHFTLREYK